MSTDTNPPVGATVVDGRGYAWRFAEDALWHWIVGNGVQITVGVQPSDHESALTALWRMQQRAEQAEAALREASEREARARPTLADVWAAYEAGVGSGQRHPDADASLISKSADAYVKSIWDFDPTTGALTRPAEAELAKLRALAVEAKATEARLGDPNQTPQQALRDLDAVSCTHGKLAALATPKKEPTP